MKNTITPFKLSWLICLLGISLSSPLNSFANAAKLRVTGEAISCGTHQYSILPVADESIAIMQSDGVHIGEIRAIHNITVEGIREVKLLGVAESKIQNGKSVCVTVVRFRTENTSQPSYRVSMFDLRTNQLIWEVEQIGLDMPVGSAEHIWIHQDQIVLLGSGRLYALSIDTGNTNWEEVLENDKRISAACLSKEANTLLIGGTGLGVEAINIQTGEKIWQNPEFIPWYGDLQVADSERIVVLDRTDRSVVVLNGQTGKLAWEKKAPSNSGFSLGSLIINDETVHVSALDQAFSYTLRSGKQL